MSTLFRMGRLRAAGGRARTAIIALTLAAGAGAPMPARIIWDALPLAARGVEQATPRPAPAEVIARWSRLIGTWVADNSQYKSDLDTFEAYGIQWTWGLNKKSIVGRLYGINGGKDVGAFWEFREIWHPAEHTLIAMQFGVDGTYGVGPNRVLPDGSTEMVQTFFHPEEQTITTVGHRARLEGDVHTTASFNVDDKGVWKARRTYLWHRQPEVP